MKKPLAIVLALVAALLLAFAGYQLGRHQSMILPSRPPAPEPDRPIAYWWDPMDPNTLYDGPGKSTMGMDLVPVYEDELEQPEGTLVSIDPRVVQNMNVRTVTVTRTDFSRTIRAVGSVEYDQEGLHQVTTKLSGWIERLHVESVGEQMEKGRPLLELYSPELVATQNEFVLAMQHERALPVGAPDYLRQDAAQLLASARKRLEYWDIPSQYIDRLAETGEVRKTLPLLAAADGVVIEKNVVEGAYIEAGANLFQIADLGDVWVNASLFENELPWIRVGQPVAITLAYFPGRSYPGRIAYIYPTLGEVARDVQVRIVVPNPDRSLMPGMYANVQIEGVAIPDALVVPSEAILRSGARAIAFVRRDVGSFEPREVELGQESDAHPTLVRVLSGLVEGEEVVISAQFLLDSESRLQEAIARLRSAPRDTASSTDAGASHLH
ncbi:MAG: efflux RND transporter periplasmic adaptor subunit [Rhodothermales bacterium]|nr:efflux RND transporter periplasmic adaptor subunit [Rhodothermales bacterium]